MRWGTTSADDRCSTPEHESSLFHPRVHRSKAIHQAMQRRGDASPSTLHPRRGPILTCKNSNHKTLHTAHVRNKGREPASRRITYNRTHPTGIPVCSKATGSAKNFSADFPSLRTPRARSSPTQQSKTRRAKPQKKAHGHSVRCYPFTRTLPVPGWAECLGKACSSVSF